MKALFLILSLSGLCGIALAEQNTVLLAASHALKMLTLDTVEEGEVSIQINVENSKCVTKKATGSQYQRHFCQFEILMDDNSGDETVTCLKSCEINFFTKGSDLNTIERNDAQAQVCIENLAEGCN